MEDSFPLLWALSVKLGHSTGCYLGKLFLWYPLHSKTTGVPCLQCCPRFSGDKGRKLDLVSDTGPVDALLPLLNPLKVSLQLRLTKLPYDVTVVKGRSKQQRACERAREAVCSGRRITLKELSSRVWAPSFSSMEIGGPMPGDEWPRRIGGG